MKTPPSAPHAAAPDASPNPSRSWHPCPISERYRTLQGVLRTSCVSGLNLRHGASGASRVSRTICT